MKKTFGFVGFGKMAGAVCGGILQSNLIDKKNIFAFDINREHLLQCADRLGINAVKSIDELMNISDTVLIATKPFVVDEILSSIKNLADNKLIISILAGITIKTYQDVLQNSRIVRVMPNTPAMVGEGMSVVCPGNSASEDDTRFVLELFAKLGRAEILPEDRINAVTAVSGSGPAFYYYIIDKIARAGEALGLEYEIALKLSAQTALGAARMILETKKEPEDLIAAVTTPNGTTAEGNKVLVNSDIEKILFETVEKTNKRAIELGLKR